jgi:phosphoglycerate dehydrogenase-like enzyme
VDRALTPASRERGLVVTNARGVFSRPIAEYVLMMILSVSRKLPQLLELQRERTWQPLEGAELRDVTVGIVGLGSIGRAVGALATAFGCRVVAVRRHSDAGTSSLSGEGGDGADRSFGELMLDRVGGPESLPELLAESDFIVLAAPLTPETREMINAETLAMVKPGSWLINVARGRLIDESALRRALREGPLGGAVLDAFREEPLQPTSPFYDLPNAIITPHTSWSSGRVLDRSVELFCDNLRRFATGQPLINVVDPTVGY